MNRRQYFFGYLFVKSAKALAFLVIAIGVGFCLLEYSQAKTAASASAYQPSASLHRVLNNLTEAFSASQNIVRSFNADHRLTTPQVEPPRFPTVIESNADFAVIDQTLFKVDRERQLLKQSIVSRFEGLVKGIELKLHAYAAGVEASSPPPAPAVNLSPMPTAPPSTVSPRLEGTLFSPKLGPGELNRRTVDLNSQKEFLKVLETKAENPENRANLTEAVWQLDALSNLLPEQLPAPAQSGSTPNGGGSDDQAPQNRKALPSERVAAQLEQLRGTVNQIFLTSWTLDDGFEQAADLNSVEREKCRVATLAHKGIWLSTVSKILVAMLVAVLGSFVILVCADLVKTFLDTASHTGVVADAINAIRGSVVINKSQVREPYPNGD